jgi:aminoglycoside phosphotransferase family enzyme/predicted kinase
VSESAPSRLPLAVASSTPDRETAFARLYLVGEDVLKLRKPVRLRLGRTPFDLSALAARAAACEEEARLDRLLAPDVTRGVLPVRIGDDGGLHFGPLAEGDASDPSVVDWALHLRRLPDADRADRRLAEGRLEDEHLVALARHVAAFHERARRAVALDAEAVLGRLRERIALRIAPLEARASDSTRVGPTEPAGSAMHEQLTEPAGSRTGDETSDFAALATWQRDFVARHAAELVARARGSAIRQGHGELALDHVFVDDSGGVRSLAGLELGSGWRDDDIAADVALLANDLAARRRADLAERFVAEYARLANDFDLYPLLDFHASLRATLNAKLDAYCADHLAANADETRRYRERARRWRALARAAPRRPLLPPVVVALGGQVASGKSTVATWIGRRLAAPVVGSDATRDFLLGARLNAELHEARWEESYTAGFGERVYAEVLRRAGQVLRSGRPVVIDGCFRSRAQRAGARALAARFGHPFLFVEARIPREVQRERLAERALRDNVPLDDWLEIADDLRAAWEPADDLPPGEHLPLDTSRPLAWSTGRIEAALPTWPEGLTD